MSLFVDDSADEAFVDLLEYCVLRLEDFRQQPPSQANEPQMERVRQLSSRLVAYASASLEPPPADIDARTLPVDIDARTLPPDIETQPAPVSICSSPEPERAPDEPEAQAPPKKRKTVSNVCPLSSSHACLY